MRRRRYITIATFGFNAIAGDTLVTEASKVQQQIHTTPALNVLHKRA